MASQVLTSPAGYLGTSVFCYEKKKTVTFVRPEQWSCNSSHYQCNKRNKTKRAARRQPLVSASSSSGSATAAPQADTPSSPPAFQTLYPPSNSHKQGYLQVSDIHTIYFEVFGNPKGKPAVFLHGGPGAGCTANHSRFFDPSHYRIVLLDQRGCGKSTPKGCLEENTTWDLVEDLEKLRRHLDIEKWLVLGGSWGVTLALAYSQTHPESVSALILRGICLMRKREIDWFYRQGADALYPFAWEHFEAEIDRNERQDMVKAYYKRMTGDDLQKAQAAASAWMRWEMSLSYFSTQPLLYTWDGKKYHALPTPSIGNLRRFQQRISQAFSTALFSTFSRKQKPPREQPKPEEESPSDDRISQQGAVNSNQRQSKPPEDSTAKPLEDPDEGPLETPKVEPLEDPKPNPASEPLDGPKAGPLETRKSELLETPRSELLEEPKAGPLEDPKPDLKPEAAEVSGPKSSENHNPKPLEDLTPGQSSAGAESSGTITPQNGGPSRGGFNWSGQGPMPSSLAQARLECHYSLHNAFLEEDQLLTNVERIRHIPAVAVQGRYDFVCPLKTAFDLHKAWPEMQLRVVPNAGHSMYEQGILHELVNATNRFRSLE